VAGLKKRGRPRRDLNTNRVSPPRLPKGMEDFSMNPEPRYTRQTWTNDPYWRQLVDQVTLAKKKGLTDEQVYMLVGADRQIVSQIIHAEEFADRKARKAFSEKVPLLQEIIGLSLNALHRTLKEMENDDELRKKMISKASDILTLVKATEGINTLLRLDLNQSTANVATRIEHNVRLSETKAVLDNMSKLDPVFSYPEITDKSIEDQKVIDEKPTPE